MVDFFSSVLNYWCIATKLQNYQKNKNKNNKVNFWRPDLTQAGPGQPLRPAFWRALTAHTSLLWQLYNTDRKQNKDLLVGSSHIVGFAVTEERSGGKEEAKD